MSQMQLQRALRMVLILGLCGGLTTLGASCSSGRGTADGMSPSGDGPGGNSDGNNGNPDGSSNIPDGGQQQQGSCTAGTYRCGTGTSVQICNSSGTAWLYSATCAVSCVSGLCTGACTPGATRCDMNQVQTCNQAGTQWTSGSTCTTYCENGQCALPGLSVTSNMNLDGQVIVDGDVTVHSGATLTSPTGNLTLQAKNITVENGASIAATPTGKNPAGAGQNAIAYYRGGGGGGYGTSGGYDASGASPGGAVFGSNTDSDVEPGGSGGSNTYGGGAGGAGGGVLRLIASGNITLAGQVTASGAAGGSGNGSDGGGGGGSGGGILIAASGSLQISGSVSATGGGPGSAPQEYGGGQGGSGRVKILSGGTRTITGTITGTQTAGLLPPLIITSSSHPDPTLTYNDNFTAVNMSWSQPFSSRQGYYQMFNTTQYDPPTPQTGTFVNMAESSTFPASALAVGDNYFHIVPEDAMSNVGTVESIFHVSINSKPPTVTSTSHPMNTWTASQNPYFQWTFPVSTGNVKGVFYVFDRYGDTIPTAQSTFIPVTQTQLQLSGIAPGIWVLHMLFQDQQDYLTKAAATYQVNIGTDPGEGTVLGQVADSMGAPLNGATVQLNRGIYSQTTNSTGNYNFTSTVPAGTWEVRASLTGHTTATQMVTVTAKNSATVNLTLP